MCITTKKEDCFWRYRQTTPSTRIMVFRFSFSGNRSHVNQERTLHSILLYPRSQLPRQYRHIDHKIVLRFLKIQPSERLDPPQAVFHGILMRMEKFRCLIEVSGTAKISCKCIEELLTLHRF